LNIGFFVLTDAFSFFLAIVLFRLDRPVPKIVFSGEPGFGRTPIDILIIIALLFIVIRYVCGDYSRRRLFWEGARASSGALLVAAIPSLGLLTLLPGHYSLFAEIGTWAFLLLSVPLMRHAMRKTLGALGLWWLPTAIICCGSRCVNVMQALKATVSLGYDVRWIASPQNAIKLKNVRHIPLDNTTEVALKLADLGCSQAVVVMDDDQGSDMSELIQRLLEADISVSFSPSFRRLPMTGLVTNYFFGRDILLMQINSNLQRFPHRLLKRTFDIVASASALVLLSPILLGIAVALKLRYPDVPVLFGQTVVGRFGREFKILKFSTMRADAHIVLKELLEKNEEMRREWEETYKLKNDPRILPGLGNFLRRSSLNELPQLFNVLTGEMSLVGPRPVRPRELIQFYGRAAQLYRRVQPGITGLWQVSGRSNTTYEERILYDEWYILNWSFWYDIVILLKTIWVVAIAKGAY
jgi:undecaprenyl-phosphate galactose phosphotransferase